MVWQQREGTVTYDVVTLGSATRDVYVRSDAFRIRRDPRSPTGKSLWLAFGTKVDLDAVFFETGGGATNTAVTFARLGLRAAFLGRVGRDVRGRAVVEVMEQEGVATSLVTHDPKLPTAYSFILSAPSGERTVLVYRGASVSVSSAMLFAHRRWRTRWLYATSLGGNLLILRKAFWYARGHRARIAWNPGASELARGKRTLTPLLRMADLLILNLEEARTLLQETGKRTPQNVVPRLCRMTGGIVVVTDGMRGSWASDGNVLYRSFTNRVHVADTTGAGDAFGSGFLTGLIKRRGDLAFALQLGTANAEGTIRILGAKTGLLRRIPGVRRLVHIVRSTLAS